MNRWEELLNPMTFRGKSPLTSFDGRNPFENDYGRLISSSSIRRLQDKTQVFPLEQSDFIRTRLTHSLEVSYIGSSLALSIEKQLIEEKTLPVKLAGHLSSLLRVAGLVHDLGNPPFGHFGEDVIQNFFKEFFNNEKNKNLLTPREIADFEKFDGNVQTFRVLRKLNDFGDDKSFNLTFPSLASVIKYPANSLEGNLGKKSPEIRKRKFGYFVSEEQAYNEVNATLNLNNKRHPIVYLLEAADDIAFCAADLEDGVKIGIVDRIDIERVFSENLTDNRCLLDYFKKLAADHQSLNVIIQKFRVKAQSIMVGEVITAFFDQYEQIMNGDLESELIYVSKAADIRNSFKKLQYQVFDDKQIMLSELAGGEAIAGLLDIFVTAILSENFDLEKSNKESRLFKNISSSYRRIYSNYSKVYYHNEKYNKIQLVVDFIVGMTDSYAITLFQKLKGIKL
jgi:dGTPase